MLNKRRQQNFSSFTSSLSRKPALKAQTICFVKRDRLNHLANKEERLCQIKLSF